MQALLSILLALLISFSTIAQGKRAMTPLDVANLKFVGSIAASDDGHYIAYTLRIQADPLVENVPAHFELHLYDLKSDQSTPFCTRGTVRSVAFRPQHGTITFLNKLDDARTTTLYEIPLSGGEARTLVAFDRSIAQYDWSPDGRSVAFVSNEESQVPSTNLPYQPEVYQGNLTYRRGYIATPGQGEPVQLGIEGNVEAMYWSPNGDRLLMSRSKTPLVDDHYMTQKLSVYDIPKKKVTGTVDHEGKLGAYIWSPDGSQIAFIAGMDINDPVAGRLFVASADGGTPKCLKPDWKGAFESVEWIDPNGITFLGSKGAESAHGLIHPNTGDMQEMPGTEGLAIGSFDINTLGGVAYTANTSAHPTELFYATSPDDNRRLTNSNPWLDEVQMGMQEVVKYKAEDGLEVEGILIYPVDYDPAKRYPLIVGVHGGPESHVNNGWITGYSYPGHVGAAKGYASFYPNYRGSTGRGLQYTLTSQGDAAGLEFDDIVNGVDHLINIGLADKDKVGVTGGSYGGYATAWLSTKYSDRFAAGVMFVGISNKVSKWGTTDIPNEEYLVHAREWVYDNYEFYLERSPVFHADKCKTPLLIMHGKEDPRVHPSQSMEMYRHVKSRTDTPVELIFLSR